MDFLNKAVKELNVLVRSMTPAARVTVGALLAVVFVSLVYLFSYQMSSFDAYLLNGKVFKPDELAHVQAALGKKDLSCTIEGMRIKIPRGRESEYTAALAEDGALPRGWNNRGEGITSGGPFESSEYRKQRIKEYTEKDLSFYVSEFKEVESARVMFDKTTTGGFRRRVITTASVSVTPVGGRELSENAVRGIRDLISGALPPMKAEDVKVVNVSTGTSYSVDDCAESGIHGNRYLTRTRDWEEEYTKKILELLDYIPGVKARVTVRLDTTESLTEKRLTRDEKATTTNAASKRSSQEGKAALSSAGHAGYAANRAMSLWLVPSQDIKASENEKWATAPNIVCGSEQMRTEVGMVPTWMSATVIVPHSYLVKVWRQENVAVEGLQARDPGEQDLLPIEQRVMASVKRSVANQLPDMKGIVDKMGQVEVAIARDICPEPIPEPSLADNTITWLSDNWRTLGLIVLALASMAMLRSMIKFAKSEQQAAAQTSRQDFKIAAGDSTDTFSDDAKMHYRKHHRANHDKNGLSMQEELSELVKEDPAAAANILKTWIGEPRMRA